MTDRCGRKVSIALSHTLSPVQVTSLFKSNDWATSSWEEATAIEPQVPMDVTADSNEDAVEEVIVEREEGDEASQRRMTRSLLSDAD